MVYQTHVPQLRWNPLEYHTWSSFTAPLQSLPFKLLTFLGITFMRSDCKGVFHYWAVYIFWHFRWFSLASKGPIAIKSVLFGVISICELYVIVCYTTLWHIIVNIYDEVALKVQRSIMFHCAVQEYGSCNIDVGASH